MHKEKLTILHSNDMHGDFFAEDQNEKMVGGLSLLSGYIRKVREEVPNCLYVISGDMLQGSIIDTEFKGISTIDLMNMLRPDVVTCGNHELDYGLAHLMFLERCAKFPIINANLNIRPTGTRLFRPYQILNVNGIEILFIGIITEEIMDNRDDLLETFVSVEEAAEEIRKICNAYRHVDIDLTVLLTHIGYEEDRRLAAMLDPALGVDLIIGGHSHTFMEQPAKVNDILIAQAGNGTDYLGRFDLVIDMDTNSVHDYTWQLVPIDDRSCPKDPLLEELLERYQSETKDKYERVLTRMKKTLYHEDRYRETALGNLIADLLREKLGVDLFILGSGSIRKDKLEEIVTLKDLHELSPFDAPLYAASVKGRTLEEMLRNFWSLYEKAQTHEFYQYSEGMQIKFDRDNRKLISIEFGGRPIEPEKVYTIGLQDFHYKNFEKNFLLPPSRLDEIRPIRLMATSEMDLIEDYFANRSDIDSNVEGRILMYKERSMGE